MSHTSSDKSYLIINLVFALIILIILLYSALHNPENSRYPIDSAYRVITDENTISTGLSRSFSEIMRCNFSEARNYNPYGIRIFLFFFIQLVFRITLLFITMRNIAIPVRIMIITDSVQAGVLFFICFWPFLKYFVNSI